MYVPILKAIQIIQTQIRWKPGSAIRHLEKRKRRGHLPPTATLKDYEDIILAVLQHKSVQVYRYWYNQIPYVTLVATINNKPWLVMFSYDGILESAFVIENPTEYLNKPGFEEIGLLSEVESE